MIYRSNLTAPDLLPHFKHAWSRPMEYAFGHDIISDWSDKADDDPLFGLHKNQVGFFTHDEATILYEIAKRQSGKWLDIGCATGWTMAHIAAAGCRVFGVDPMLRFAAWQERIEENLEHCWGSVESLHSTKSSNFFDASVRKWDGILIDGDHDPGEPERDAVKAAEHLSEHGVIMLHDGTGGPVRTAVRWLMDQGFNARAYFTPHLLFCCWRGSFAPPDHYPDHKVYVQLTDGRYGDFDFSRCC